MRERILIADGNNLSLRAIYGCAALYDRMGTPTGCLMTSVRMICKAAQAVGPRRTIFVWDGGHSSYRKSIYPEYKLRKQLSEDDPKLDVISEWEQQVKLLQNYLPLLGVGNIKIIGCEADDVIYKLTKVFNSVGYDSVIATTDADFYQLLGDSCSVYNIAKDIIYDHEKLFTEYGVRPREWVLLRAMTGDGSDNIEGIYGVGPKKAASIIKEFGSWRLFLDYCDKYSESLASASKYKRDVFAGREIVERNIKLMDLEKLPDNEVPEIELNNQLDNALGHVVDKKAFWQKCMKHELNTLMEESHYWQKLCGECND